MLMPSYNEPLQSYKSYKAQKFEKAISRAKALRQSIIDSSLKPEDKIKILNKIKDELVF